jgi:hypothetical protein
MKFLCINFLIFFISFLSTPTIVSIVDNEVDISCFYNLCEEEENLEFFDKIKSVPYIDFEFGNLSCNLLKLLNVSSETNLSFTNLAHQIFSPPPNIV